MGWWGGKGDGGGGGGWRKEINLLGKVFGNSLGDFQGLIYRIIIGKIADCYGNVFINNYLLIFNVFKLITIFVMIEFE